MKERRAGGYLDDLSLGSSDRRSMEKRARRERDESADVEVSPQHQERLERLLLDGIDDPALALKLRSRLPCKVTSFELEVALAERLSPVGPDAALAYASWLLASERGWHSAHGDDRDSVGILDASTSLGDSPLASRPLEGFGEAFGFLEEAENSLEASPLLPATASKSRKPERSAGAVPVLYIHRRKAVTRDEAAPVRAALSPTVAAEWSSPAANAAPTRLAARLRPGNIEPSDSDPRDVLEEVLELVRSEGTGELLPANVLAEAQTRLGAVAARVRIHTSSIANQAAALLGASAFTIGRDIYFAAGEYAPGTGEGDRLLRHELTHVMQHERGQLTAGSRSELLASSSAAEAEARAAEADEVENWAGVRRPQPRRSKGKNLGRDDKLDLPMGLALPANSRSAPTAAIQLKVEGADPAPEDAETLHTALERRGSGQPLPDAVRRKMEGALGADFSAVRIHEGPEAAAAGAIAFAHGTDIFFAPGQYDPESRRGQELLGHELAHVVQQAQGRAQPTAIAGGVAIDNSSVLEREADELGARAAAAPAHVDGVAAVRSPSAALQAPPADLIEVAAVSRAVVQRAPASEVPAASVSAPGTSEEKEDAPAGLKPAPDNDNVSPGSGPAEQKSVSSETAGGTSPVVDAGAGAGEEGRGGNETTGSDSSSESGGAAPLEGVVASTVSSGDSKDGPSFGQAEATHGSPGNLLVQDTDPGPDPAHSKLTRSARQIQNAARAEKAALSQSAKQQRKTIEQQSTQQVIAMRAEGSVKLAELVAGIKAKRDEVKQTFTTAKAQLKQKIAQQKLAARTDGQKALEDLKKAILAQKLAASQAMRTEAELMDAAGARESKRVNQSMVSTIAAINRAKSSASSAYSGKEEKVRSSVDEVLSKAAGDMIADVRGRNTELSKAVLDSSSKVSRSIREAGVKLVAQIGTKSADLEKSIRDGTTSAVEQIEKLGRESETQLGTLEKKATSALDGAEQTAKSQVQQAIDGSIGKLEGECKKVQGELEQSEAAAVAALDKGAATAIGRLREVPSGEEISDEAVQEFEETSTGKLREACAKTIEAIVDQAGRIVASLTNLVGSFSTNLGAATARVREGIDAATSAMSDAATVPLGVEAKCKELREEVKKGYEAGIKKIGTDSKQQIDDAKGGWAAERTKVEGELKGKVDECVAKNGEAAAQAPGKFADTAKATAAEAEKSWLSRAWDGIKSGFMKFVKGLGLFLLVLLAVFLIVLVVLVIGALLAGAAITLALVAKALAIALLIVGIAFLIVGLIMAVIHRFGSFWEALGDLPWWQKLLITIACSPYLLLVSVLDVFGVSGIIEWLIGYDLSTFRELSTEERWERLTMGVLTILTILIIKRVNAKLPSVGRPVGPEVDPARPVDPVDPVDPTRPVDPVDPTRPADPVDPTRPVEPVEPVEPADPNLPPGYDPTIRTLPELQADRSPTPRPGETLAQAQARARAAETEILRRAPEIMESLGDAPRRVNPRVEDPNHPDAHTTGPRGRHDADIPLHRTDAPPGARTIEGRIYGDQPWIRAERASMKWFSDSIMVRVINQYLRANWEQIKLDLAVNGEHNSGFDAGMAVGEGFVNSGTAAAPNPVYTVSSLVRISIQFVPGPPPDFYIITSFPAPMGVP